MLRIDPESSENKIEYPSVHSEFEVHAELHAAIKHTVHGADFARMTEDNLLSHPAVQANAAARELIEAAITSLAEAYQILCQDQGD